MKKVLYQTRFNVGLKIRSLVFILICVANSASAFVTTICDNNGTAQHPVWICMTLQNVPCSQVSYIAGMTCSEQYFAVPPKIIVLKDGGVVIDNKGVLSTFASDKVNKFLLEKVSKISAEEKKRQYSELLKNDDHKVSKTRVEALRKELNAEIIYSDLTMATYRSAANAAKPSTSAVLSLSGGVINPVSSIKREANLSNSYSFGANLYLPVIGSRTVDYGINMGGEYFAGNTDYNKGNFTAYNITGQNGDPVVSAKGAGSPKQAGFKTEVGVQANLSFGHLTISPVLNATYINLKQKAFAVSQSSSVNGQSRDFNLYSQTETKTTGFGFVPKLQMRYKFGRDSKFSVYTEASYTLGPDVKNESRGFKPSGLADQKTGAYSVDQMLNGTQVALTKNNSYNTFGVNVGVSFSFRRKKGYDYYKAKGDMSSVAKGENPLYENNGTSGVNPLSERAAKKAARQAKKAAKKAN